MMSSFDELVLSGWLSTDLLIQNVIWFKLTFFFSFALAQIHFYQWDVCVGRKTNNYEEISIFKVGSKNPNHCGAKFPFLLPLTSENFFS